MAPGASQKKEQSTEFNVSLEGIKLPPGVERAIEDEIRKVVMLHLATIDLKGDLQVLSRSSLKSLRGGTAGIAVRLV